MLIDKTEECMMNHTNCNRYSTKYAKMFHKKCNITSLVKENNYNSIFDQNLMNTKTKVHNH